MTHCIVIHFMQQLLLTVFGDWPPCDSNHCYNHGVKAEVYLRDCCCNNWALCCYSCYMITMIAQLLL